ncbi:hypothetical protein Poli38472_003890 [Pythium oligandrum]|uniref:AB hydrolase-1 domain-containing protein n=1 Tax=Pythium oligandrum TaxID=41045 RepID=A0A8K1CP12_PYTOL|nr:hypothetical protein Poli38472_003890 [Pythium oligandrum]|eukprot:TMW66125.1 hypothetical protein Poli38472_003890 [Pythium oligandrum]
MRHTRLLSAMGTSCHFSTASPVGSNASGGRGVSLLFTHGCGFCKETWNPVIKRLQQTPLFQRTPAEMVTFDLTYHGTKSDNSKAATVHLEDPSKPRISHPAEHWPVLVTDDVRHEIRSLREKQSEHTPLIGVGHSMGAAALWAVEVANPGTFDGLVLFEPILNLHEYANAQLATNFLVSVTLPRINEWNSREEAEAYFRSAKAFARWHPEALDAYLEGAIVKNDPDNNGFGVKSAYTLACHPQIEASHYAGDQIHLSMEQMASVGCKVVFQFASNTQMFFAEPKKPLIEAHPDLYSIAEEPIPKTTHLMVLENPDAVVERIIEAFHTFPGFQNGSGGSSP